MNSLKIIAKSDMRKDITMIRYFDDIPGMLFAGTYN